MTFTREELELILESMGQFRSEAIKQKIEGFLKEADSYEYCLWDFHWDYGRQGDVDGRFKATRKQMELIKGHEIRFGEILGKHSDVYNTIDDNDLTLVSDDPIVVMDAEESGYNPFDYWYCEDCGCTLDPDTGKCEDCDKEEEDVQ